ncbi:hypothetical protein ACFVW9_40310 [Streptomyces sp. NPDC058217]|uniref:hypothetical protein n=1 Tax=Streptomyces sp. NPDC058217 TaxID=3346384 RepID=UPI0036E8EFA1
MSANSMIARARTRATSQLGWRSPLPDQERNEGCRQGAGFTEDGELKDGQIPTAPEWAEEAGATAVQQKSPELGRFMAA